MRRILLLVGCVFAALITLGVVLNYLRTVNDARSAIEAQAAVESFLRAQDSSALSRLFPRGNAPADLGSFIRLDGEGFIYPVWNIQGYHFLDLHRTAIFQRGGTRVRIIVKEGDPGQTGLGSPSIQEGMIFISHPKVKG